MPLAVVALHTIITKTWLQNCGLERADRWHRRLLGVLGAAAAAGQRVQGLAALGGRQGGTWDPTVLSAVITGIAGVVGMTMIYLVVNSDTTVRCWSRRRTTSRLFNTGCGAHILPGVPLALAVLTRLAEQKVVKTKVLPTKSSKSSKTSKAVSVFEIKAAPTRSNIQQLRNSVQQSLSMQNQQNKQDMHESSDSDSDFESDTKDVHLDSSDLSESGIRVIRRPPRCTASSSTSFVEVRAFEVRTFEVRNFEVRTFR